MTKHLGRLNEGKSFSYVIYFRWPVLIIKHISSFLCVHRKKPPVQYVRCEMEGCGTVLAHPRYLQVCHLVNCNHDYPKYFQMHCLAFGRSNMEIKWMVYSIEY